MTTDSYRAATNLNGLPIRLFNGLRFFVTEEPFLKSRMQRKLHVPFKGKLLTSHFRGWQSTLLRGLDEDEEEP